MSSNHAPQSLPAHVGESWIRPNPTSVMTFISTIDPKFHFEADHQAEQPEPLSAEAPDQSPWS